MGASRAQTPTGLSPVDAEASSDDPGIPIPGGWFYRAAASDLDADLGFAVYDGHGAALWTAYQAQGGPDELGLPVSRRFELDEDQAQLFEHGVLRWDADRRNAVWVPVDQLDADSVPDWATVPELPPFASGEAARTPWSGWWWPSNQALGRTMFAVGGPLDKYDQYIGRALSYNPGTRAWEQRENNFPGSGWAGHCNGWAAAALLEPEPTAPRTELGITFGVGDQKGLLSYYHFADAARWSFGAGGTTPPEEFQRVLLYWLGADPAKGFVLTYEMGGGEVWSYPVYRFDSSWQADPTVPYRWRVKTTLWMAEMEVPPDFVGLRTNPGPAGKTFEYTLDGDPRDPSGGAWTGASTTGRFAHPGRIWYPEPTAQNLDRQWISPEIDRGTILNILGRPEEPPPGLDDLRDPDLERPGPVPAPVAEPEPGP